MMVEIVLTIFAYALATAVGIMTFIDEIQTETDLAKAVFWPITLVKWLFKALYIAVVK